MCRGCGEFHKVHHSVDEMGFGALLRYHFVENIIYRTLEYLPLAMIGFGIRDFFHRPHFHARHRATGPRQSVHSSGQGEVFPEWSAELHLWHHAKEMPASHPAGFNYGITLSVWDYLFKTDYWPKNDEYLSVGLPEAEAFPKDFVGQMVRPFQNLAQKEKAVNMPSTLVTASPPPKP